MLDVEPLTATIGAEVGGVDLADDLDDAVIEEIRDALLEWKVLFFRDQHRLDRDEPRRVRAPVRRARGAPDHAEGPGAARGVRHPRGRQVPGAGQLALRRHLAAGAVDGVDPARRRAAAARRRHVVGRHGQGLRPARRRTKERIDGRMATHDYASAFGAASRPRCRSGCGRSTRRSSTRSSARTRRPGARRCTSTSASPLDRRHGRRRGAAAAAPLYRQSSIVDVQCRFRWRPGSVAFWDNRATQHVVTNDFLPRQRVMERVTVVGDKPF